MANNENLKPVRTKSEARERGRAGGKASGEARRRKADFRRTLQYSSHRTGIDRTEWTPILKAMGLDSTLESAVNMAMIKEALAGNVKAYVAIKDVLGQTSKSDTDLEEQQLRMAATKSKLGTDVEEEPEDDGFLDALNESAADDWDREQWKEKTEMMKKKRPIFKFQPFSRETASDIHLVGGQEPGKGCSRHYRGRSDPFRKDRQHEPVLCDVGDVKV